MRTVTVDLEKGLSLNGVDQRSAVIREATVGDVVNAQLESSNEIISGIVMLGLQIQRIGDIQGPLSLGEISKLTCRDMDILQAAAEGLESRGRDQSEAGDSRQDGLRDTPAPAHRNDTLRDQSAA